MKYAFGRMKTGVGERLQIRLAVRVQYGIAPRSRSLDNRSIPRALLASTFHVLEWCAREISSVIPAIAVESEDSDGMDDWW